MKELKHPKPWLIVGGIGFVFGTFGALDLETIELAQGIVQSIIGMLVVWAATFLPDTNG